jgi:hypothetical protein
MRLESFVMLTIAPSLLPFAPMPEAPDSSAKSVRQTAPPPFKFADNLPWPAELPGLNLRSGQK